MPYIKRNLEKIVQEVTLEYPVILLAGPRQVGKTTMLMKLMEGSERSYVTLDNLSERALAKSDPELFLQLHKPPILIDEVQYAPELFTYIKIYVDQHHTPGSFWLTSSHIFKSLQGIHVSLAGRVAVLSMTSLTQAESCGESVTPFTVDLESLTERAKPRPPMRMPYLSVSSKVPCLRCSVVLSVTARFFIAVTSAHTLNAMLKIFLIPLTL